MLFKLVLIIAVLSVSGGTYQDTFYNKREAMGMGWLANIWSKIIAGDDKQFHRKQSKIIAGDGKKIHRKQSNIIAGDDKQFHRKPRLSHGSKLLQAVFENNKRHFSGRKFTPRGYVRLV